MTTIKVDGTALSATFDEAWRTQNTVCGGGVCMTIEPVPATPADREQVVFRRSVLSSHLGPVQHLGRSTRRPALAVPSKPPIHDRVDRVSRVLVAHSPRQRSLVLRPSQEFLRARPVAPVAKTRSTARRNPFSRKRRKTDDRVSKAAKLAPLVVVNQVMKVPATILEVGRWADSLDPMAGLMPDPTCGLRLLVERIFCYLATPLHDLLDAWEAHEESWVAAYDSLPEWYVRSAHEGMLDVALTVAIAAVRSGLVLVRPAAKALPAAKKGVAERSVDVRRVRRSLPLKQVAQPKDATHVAQQVYRSGNRTFKHRHPYELIQEAKKLQLFHALRLQKTALPRLTAISLEDEILEMTYVPGRTLTAMMESLASHPVGSKARTQALAELGRAAEALGQSLAEMSSVRVPIGVRRGIKGAGSLQLGDFTDLLNQVNDNIFWNGARVRPFLSMDAKTEQGLIQVIRKSNRLKQRPTVEVVDRSSFNILWDSQTSRLAHIDFELVGFGAPEQMLADAVRTFSPLSFAENGLRPRELRQLTRHLFSGYGEEALARLDREVLDLQTLYANLREIENFTDRPLNSLRRTWQLLASTRKVNQQIRRFAKQPTPSMQAHPNSFIALTRIRSLYVQEIAAIKERVLKGATMADVSAWPAAKQEKIARRLHQERRDLGKRLKKMSPEVLDQLLERNVARYNDPYGPTIDFLRHQRNKSWVEIIESALRPGGNEYRWINLVANFQ